MSLNLSIDRRLTWLTLGVLPILISLGFWQLDRAAEKRQQQAELTERQQRQAVPLTSLTPEQEQRYTPVSLEGRFDSAHRFLLDNQVRDGQVGYDVLVPFAYQTAEGSAWALVNRGWIAAPTHRETMPTVPPAPAGQVRVIGQLYIPDGEAFQLAAQQRTDPDWPQVVQVVDTAQFGQWLGRDFYPHQIRLAVDDPAALLAQWQTISVPAEKHVGYAVQWFGMALGLVIWYLFANTGLRDWWRRRRVDKPTPGKSD